MQKENIFCLFYKPGAFLPPLPASSTSLNASSFDFADGSMIFVVATSATASAGDIDLAHSSSGWVLFGPLVTSFVELISFFTSRVSNIDIGSEPARRCASALLSLGAVADVSSPDDDDDPLLPITSNDVCCCCCLLLLLVELIGVGVGVGDEVARDLGEGALELFCWLGSSMPLSMLVVVVCGWWGGWEGDWELLITLLPVEGLMGL